MSDEYAQYTKGKLKLKTDSEISKKKKKKKKSSKKDEEEKIANTSKDTIQIRADEERYTKAELSYKKMQEKMQNKRVKEKAQMTHKQQVEKFNEKLDQLTEHFDIPKVSWTK